MKANNLFQWFDQLKFSISLGFISMFFISILYCYFFCWINLTTEICIEENAVENLDGKDMDPSNSFKNRAKEYFLFYM